MKARGKLVSLLTALVCLLPLGAGLLGFGDSASAATPETVDVTLHKKKMDEFPDVGLENTGELMEGDDEFGRYDPLPGVTFTPYDVTKDFYRLLAAKNLTGNETDDQYKAIVKDIMENAKESDFGDKVPAGSPVDTDANGEAKFSGLPDRDENGRYKVYWFQETNGPVDGEYHQLALLMLPVMKSDQVTVNKDIHLYPKNKVETKVEKELVDADENPRPAADRYSYDVGKVITYKATFTMPNQIGEVIKNSNGTEQTRYSKFVLRDQVSHDGVRFEQIDKILIDGSPVQLSDFTHTSYTNTQYFNQGSSYAATGEKAGFEIAFKFNNSTSGPQLIESKNVADYLKQYRGQKVEIFYSVSLTEDTPVDQDINNEFYVDMTRDGSDKKIEVENPPVVITGGKKFMKHEDRDENQGLKGAEFVVIKEVTIGNELYLKKDANGKWSWAAVTGNYDDAYKFISDQNGLFEVTGLEFDTYKLREVKAPDGFKKRTDDIPFVIEKDSYDGDAESLKVANVSKGGFLPSTGGIGIVIFLVIGGSLMAFAVNRYRKQQRTA